jgi:hypothetical protein
LTLERFYPDGLPGCYKQHNEGSNGVRDVSDTVIRRRDDLRLLEGTLVEVSGRVKEFRKHERRRDLDTVLLTNLIITPSPIGESVFVGHLWFLRRQFKKIGGVPEQNERIKFLGEVYSYRRLGGKSLDRNLFNTTDYGVKPVSYANRD